MMHTALRFGITFYSPFRVSTGQAGRGIDATVNRDNPLPGSSIKGVMRDAARLVLRARPQLVAEVFGSESAASPWVWSPAQTENGMWTRTSVQTRVSIDEDTHTAVADRLVFAEIVEHPAAVFSIESIGSLPDARLAVHRVLLRASARAVHHVGAERRRGLGWVAITPLGDSGEAVPVSPEDLHLIRGGV